MYLLTNLDFFQGDNSTGGWHTVQKVYQPVEKTDNTTVHKDADDSLKSEPTSTQSSQKTFEPPIANVWLPTIADTTPLQIWEGTVLNVNFEDNVMNVLLNAKMEQVPKHTADIDFEWVSDQDMDLVRPGAIFYLTLYKRTKQGGSIENSQELRFRRLLSWSPMELKRIEEQASTLLSKMTTLPTAK